MTLQNIHSNQLVIIPVFNEELHICSVFREIRTVYSGSILAVNDGSSDRSAERMQAFNDPDLIILEHKENYGYGRALMTGFNYALTHGYERVLTMDCDQQHQPQFIHSFFQALDCSDLPSERVDIVSGSRYLQLNTGDDLAPEDRFSINVQITELINQITGYHLTDAFCGFKAYSTTALSKLNLSEPGYGMPLQLWIQAASAGLRIKELPVPRIYITNDRTFGEMLDDPFNRLNYYKSIINREVSKCPSI